MHRKVDERDKTSEEKWQESRKSFQIFIVTSCLHIPVIKSQQGWSDVQHEGEKRTRKHTCRLKTANHRAWLEIISHSKSQRLIQGFNIWWLFWSHRLCPAPSPFDEALLYLPDAVQDAAILENPQQLVVCGDLVEVGSFLICEEQIWFPDGI